MKKSELLTDLEGRVTRIITTTLQEQDTNKIAARINPYLSAFMFSKNGISKGENVLFYVYDEGTTGESAEYDERSFARVFGGQVYTGNLTDVKARAVEIIGSVDESKVQDAFDVMTGEETTTQKPENFESELAIMSRLGIAQAEAILGKIEGYLSSQGLGRVIRMIQSDRGVNLADPQTIGLAAGLVAGGVLTQAEADALLASNSETALRWPNLAEWQVLEALRL